MITGIHATVWEPFDISIDDRRGKEQHGALLRTGDSGEPVAYARLTLPGRRMLVGKRSSTADFVLVSRVHSGLSGDRPADLARWQLRLAWVLDVPRDLASFINDKFSLRSADYPAAEVVLRITTPPGRNLTELVDIRDCTSLPRPSPRSDFSIIARADRNGGDIWASARTWMERLCDKALYLNNYESALGKAEALKELAPPINLPKEVTRKQFLISLGAGGAITFMIVSATDKLLGGTAIPPAISKGQGDGKPYLQTTTTLPPELTSTASLPPTF